MRGSRSKTEATPQQKKLIGMILAGVSIKQASRELGIDESTGKRWMRNPVVLEAYEKLKKSVEGTVFEQVQALGSKAVKALDDSLSPTELTQNRIKAAQMVLDRVLPQQTPGQTGQTPGQASQGLIDASLMHYMSEQEIATIEEIVQAAFTRKEKADQDRERLKA
jgi:hypothetical protein